jgi:hypothetical protein
MNIQIAMQLAKKSGIIEGRRYGIRFSSLEGFNKMRVPLARVRIDLGGRYDVRRTTAAGSVDQPAKSTAICFFSFPLPETKKPAAGGGAAGFRKEPNSNWEEECCCSHKRPREEGKVACKSETMREEVHRFDNAIIRETCLLHRHLFAQQPCVMRKAGRSLVKSQTEKCPA